MQPSVEYAEKAERTGFRALIGNDGASGSRKEACASEGEEAPVKEAGFIVDQVETELGSSGVLVLFLNPPNRLPVQPDSGCFYSSDVLRCYLNW